MLGMLKRYTVELSPEVKGRLTHNNTPITNQIIERSLTYADEELIDTCTTDNNGEFYFPAKSIKSRLPGSIFHEPVVRQIIYVEYREKELYIWFTNQHDIVCPKICKKNLIKLEADTANKEEVFELENISLPEFPYVIKSICSL